ncbi:type I restriction endonuclease subunit R [Vibrio alginolyticus]|nr:type I restriction endonuclease subunit R [Vibrio alginolyticus]
MSQSEAELERQLIAQLTELGYDKVIISNAEQLKTNLKNQLEKHNQVTLSDSEFSRVLNKLDKGAVFDKAELLREPKIQITGDDDSPIYLNLLNTEHWCQNQYQVTHQISQEGTYKNRYDVTLLINGLPLVQIELKRRGMEIKEAFNQINRYQRQSFWSEHGLFQFVQLFVISNGANTKYYANNRHQDFKQTFTWSTMDNEQINELELFAEIFLEKCHLSKMICKYIVLHQSDKILMALRPYQFYAAEAIYEKVKTSEQNGYIWHTTGSGKTLTSFKTAQLICELPEEKVAKVMFVVDRADLDYQTALEFNYFSEGCVDETKNTRSLVQQMSGNNRLIVTTIQKLNNAITNERYGEIETLKNQPVIFIFDECHRSQFGTTHKNICAFFNKAQMFGFTGTPILENNATKNEHGKRTTKDLFGERLHSYLLPHAIGDQNVLRFAVEYWGKLKRKDGSLIDEDKAVASIDKKEFFESEDRINNIVDWVIHNHNRKTHNKQFSAMMCVSSVDALNTYYDLFKRKKEAGDHDLRVVTIFTYSANEEDIEANGLIGEPDFDIPENMHSRDKLESYIDDYNKMYKTNHSAKDSKGFYAYYKDIAKRMKERDKKSFKDEDRADILLVVNMFLTGFDAKKVNTLYVDKNLKHHGLIQAFSRTNRILGELKSQGNIICFRNLKPKTDEAIALFSNKNASEVVLMDPYDTYVEKFNKEVKELELITPTPADVDKLLSEKDQVRFIQAFRALMRTLNVLKCFTEFAFDDLLMDDDTFSNYKSKYLDLYEKTRSEDNGDGGDSILNDVDFELELIHKDKINVAYILELLAQAYQESQSGDEKTKAQGEEKRRVITDMLQQESQLRSKRTLIQKFIEEYMPTLKPSQSIQKEFGIYWDAEKESAINTLCTEEKLKIDALKQMISAYLFSGKMPLRDTVFDAMEEKPKLLQRKKVFERVSEKILDFISTFEDDMGDLDI